MTDIEKERAKEEGEDRGNEIHNTSPVDNTPTQESPDGIKYHGSLAFYIILILIGLMLISVALPQKMEKPVIYLYPRQPLEVSIQLDYKGVLECSYPLYKDGWNVTAHPDGRLVDRSDGREYSSLFWEGKGKIAFDFSQGFVVKGADTVEFLREKLTLLGLTPREYNEFIVYWLPLMQKNPYNLIAFQGKNYTDNAVLTVSPQPDSMLRVFMAFKPLNAPIDIPPQELKPFERKGFTLVEWGGSRVF